MLCVGNSIGIFIGGRVLQGLSAAVVWTTGLALLVDTVGEEHIGEQMGYVGMGMSFAILLAPLLGGVVFNRSGYYPVFGMCFALIGIDIFFRLTMIEKKIAIQWLPPDVNNEEKIAINAITPEQKSDENVTTDTGDIASLEPAKESTLVPAPSLRLLNAEAPFASPPGFKLPPIISLLGSPRMLAALWGCIIQASLLTAFDSVLPLRVQAIFGWDSLGAGLIFLPFVLPSFVAPVIGAYADRWGARYLAVGGFLIATPFLALLRLVTHNSLGQKAVLCVLLAGIGFSVNLTLMPLMAEIAYIVDAKEKERPGSFGSNGAYAQAYGLFNTAYAAGCLVGPIWAGLLEEKKGWGTVTWTLALLSAVSTIPTLLFTGGWIFNKENRKRRIAKVVKEERGADETALEEDESRAVI